VAQAVDQASKCEALSSKPSTIPPKKGGGNICSMHIIQRFDVFFICLWCWDGTQGLACGRQVLTEPHFQPKGLISPT
jgi:hypothetical protein